MEGLLLGLSTGSVCLATCSPIYLPWLISEDRSIRKTFMKIMEISAGRFISYLIFGALAGYLGSNIKQMNRELFTGISYLFLTVFLFINSFRTTRHDKKCLVPKWSTFSKSAFLLGVLTGINFCPSFLIALTNSFGLGGVWAGILLFTGFFVGTTVFLLPLVFSGFLTSMHIIKKIARVASIVIALWFFYKGVESLIHTWHVHEADKGKIEIVLNNPDLQPVIILTESDARDMKELTDSLSVIYKEKAEIQHSNSFTFSQINIQKLYLIDDRVLVQGDSLGAHIIRFHQENDIHSILSFLQNYNFKVKKGKGLYWRM